MDRYINASKMPTGRFWEECTDNEKQKILGYLIGSPGVSVVPREVVYELFEKLEQLLEEHSCYDTLIGDKYCNHYYDDDDGSLLKGFYKLRHYYENYGIEGMDNTL